ncbi:protein NO VEIN domain-containing protein [Gordonia paraffinivorans]|uniref:protein NO VEIN domain-containing protein n=1 Tax=Gordonia paraffinivorans TaxID=175628 RepID=UPI001FFA44C6|nr:DUF3883 domain-containing protein [Gordonia paraffinivorans]
MSDIKQSNVVAATEVLDDPDQAELVESLNFRDATKYRLAYRGKLYDSKAVIGIAHGLATGTYWGAKDFSGGMSPGHAAHTLQQLGFFIDDGPLFDLTRITIDRTHGRPAPYQYLVLRWAIARARAGAARTARYSDVRQELSDLLRPYAIGQTAPDPAMPWLALRRSNWWDLETPPEASRLTDADVRRLDLKGGLTDELYRRISEQSEFALAATEVLDHLIEEATATAPPSMSGPPRGGPAGLLLTWNPDHWSWTSDYDEADYDNAIATTALGGVVREGWSTRRYRDIKVGDRAFLLKQGDQGRGIVASGVVAGDPEIRPHWNGSGEQQRRVPVDWDVVLGPDQLLPTDILEDELPQQNWRPLGSGITIKPDVLRQLETLWSQHLAGLTWPDSTERKPGSGGQGITIDPLKRKKIEDAAQNRLMSYFADRGWNVVDTRFGSPYDAVATKGPQVLYLEAKGTQSSGDTVFVTRGEVRHARANKGRCVLGIWSSMQFDDNGEIDTTAGTFRILPFEPDDDHLTPTQYVYLLPSGDESTSP